MTERPLAFHKNQTMIRESLASPHHCCLHRSCGVIHSDGIQGNAVSADQDPCLTGTNETSWMGAVLCRRQQFKADAHLSNGHVGSHRQHPLTGKSRLTALPHPQLRRLLTQIPDPAVQAVGIQTVQGPPPDGYGGGP